MNKKYLNIIKHYEACFDKNGDTNKGVDWPNMEDLMKRFEVMTDIITDKTDFSILDFGCGNGLIIPFLNQKFAESNFFYQGHDISEKYIKHCIIKYPDHKFSCGDLLNEFIFERKFDYIIMNGVFTEKHDLSFDEMLVYFKNLLLEIYKVSNKGFAFNVMSSHVDWLRDDLFHLPLDILADFLIKNITRDFVIRNDYGLYEYTVYIYKK